MSDFWADMNEVYAVESAIDHHLMDHELDGEHFQQVRKLTEKDRKANALSLPVDAGARVSFITNLGSLLTYSDPPDEGLEGTVVTVRTAQGDTTFQDERVFVAWDDGQFRAILAEHLRRAKGNRRQARNVRLVLADIGDLSQFFVPAGGVSRKADDLVHKATKDLWSFRQEGKNFVIERLFQENGEPLKV